MSDSANMVWLHDDVLKPFKGGEDDMSTWIDKFELVTNLRKVKNLEEVLPLLLEGPACTVYL